MINPIHDLFISLARNSHELFGTGSLTNIAKSKTLDKEKLENLKELHYELMQAETFCSQIPKNEDNEDKIDFLYKKIQHLKDLIPKLEKKISF